MMVVCKFQKLMRQTLFELAIEGFRNKIQTNSSHLLGKQFFSFEKECLTKGDINTRNHILDIVYHIICELTTECDSVNNSQVVRNSVTKIRCYHQRGTVEVGVGHISFQIGGGDIHRSR